MDTPSHQAVKSAWISLGASILILSLKFAAYSMTHSQAVFSDALESVVNVIAAIIAVAVMRAVAAPADEEHPYGHGKLEYFSAAFEGGLISFAAVAIAFEAIRSLIFGHEIRQIDLGLIVVSVAAGFNALLGYHLRLVGRKNRSEALLASSAHVFSDVWTTVGVVIGLIVVKLTGWLWLDPVVALFVAIQLGFSGIKIVRRSAGSLIDEVDKSSLQSLGEALNKHKRPGLIDVHNVRIIRSGRFHHVDAHLVVPDFWDVLRVHTESQDFEKKVVESYHYDGEFAFHIDPCRSEFCSICDYPDCPIRRRQFQGLRAMTMDSIIKPATADAP